MSTEGGLKALNGLTGQARVVERVTPTAEFVTAVSGSSDPRQPAGEGGQRIGGKVVSNRGCADEARKAINGSADLKSARPASLRAATLIAGVLALTACGPADADRAAPAGSSTAAHDAAFPGIAARCKEPRLGPPSRARQCLRPIRRGRGTWRTTDSSKLNL